MASKSGALATGSIELGSAHQGSMAHTWMISVKGASGLALTFQGWPSNDAAFTTSDGTALFYRDMSSATDAAGATAVTANGNYKVFSDRLNLTINVSSGTGTYSAEPYAG